MFQSIISNFSLKNKRADVQLTFGCQVVKQDDLDLGAVLLYQNNQNLLAVGYSVGAEQLATEEQVRTVGCRMAATVNREPKTSFRSKRSW